MKIQCNACEAAEATVLCCADEAALCLACDRKVHAANKLAGKHQRFPLSTSSSQMPICDICQETIGYFFCLEDRALLCRKCDVAIHKANSLVSSHQRFLLTGVRVGPESCSLSTPLVQASASDDFPSPNSTFAEGIPHWELDEFIGLSEFNFANDPSTKADGGKLGDPECAQILRAGEVELEGCECLGQVSEAYWAVPEISTLYWPKDCKNASDSADFVPDLSCSLHERKHF